MLIDLPDAEAAEIRREIREMMAVEANHPTDRHQCKCCRATSYYSYGIRHYDFCIGLKLLRLLGEKKS
jgi:hypothetical protein